MIRASLSSAPAEPVSHDAAIVKRVLLRAGTVANLMQLAESRLAAGQSTTPHAHADMAEVFLATTGAGEVRVDGRAYPLEAGTCVVVEPGEVHQIVNTGAAELVLLYFGLLDPRSAEARRGDAGR